MYGRGTVVRPRVRFQWQADLSKYEKPLFAAGAGSPAYLDLAGRQKTLCPRAGCGGLPGPIEPDADRDPSDCRRIPVSRTPLPRTRFRRRRVEMFLFPRVLCTLCGLKVFGRAPRTSPGVVSCLRRRSSRAASIGIDLAPATPCPGIHFATGTFRSWEFGEFSRCDRIVAQTRTVERTIPNTYLQYCAIIL